ncbi:MAG: hypothetical protein APZ16_02695 [Candidatus Hadarchaeum yellowstonense]|uniref:Uncharacterized protein n=1 Tax=Hadarchaeum yellowstonense TaxID=1776334 RepID=A0A147JWG7_HADYE|nr:MAG: hypothetical protein APZ16_02695 [Candidatus Hadarchaeum yellowstonense]
MEEGNPSLSEMPRIYDIFEAPKIKSLRATSKINKNLDIAEVLKRLPRVKSISTSKKNVVRFTVKRGNYLLLFPNGYIEIHAADEGEIREILSAFREELFKAGLI